MIGLAADFIEDLYHNFQKTAFDEPPGRPMTEADRQAEIYNAALECSGESGLPIGCFLAHPDDDRWGNFWAYNAGNHDYDQEVAERAYQRAFG